MSAFLSALADATGISSTVSADVSSAERYATIAYVVLALEGAIVIFLLAKIARRA